ncbi:hypothetical protein I9X38_07555 [Bacillus mojavensis]|nr:hypothetical protein I9X38_07555 [Bacillus mojavensis]
MIQCVGVKGLESWRDNDGEGRDGEEKGNREVKEWGEKRKRYSGRVDDVLEVLRKRHSTQVPELLRFPAPDR